MEVPISFTKAFFPDELKTSFTTYTRVFRVDGAAPKYLCAALGKGFNCKYFLPASTELGPPS